MNEGAALSGVTVVAIEQAVAAPYCTSRLADAGARVIKIERKGGETARHYDSVVNGVSAYFAWLNRGKESAVLDLKTTDDLALLRRLLAEADVLIQNLAPGAFARLGFTAEELACINPRLIFVSIVGYGKNTSYASKRAYDMLIQAESGICAVTGSESAPSKVGISIADIATGMNAHAAILEAIIEREKTGCGKAIEVSMFDSMADWMNVPLLHFDYARRSSPRLGLSHASIYPYRPYNCRDGAVVIVVQNPDEWARLCESVLDNPDLGNDPRFSDNPARVKNRDALDHEIEPVFAKMTVQEAVEKLENAKLAWGRVSTINDLSGHPALNRIEAYAGEERFRLAAPALHRNAPCKRVPSLGYHTSAIRAEFSG